MKPSSETGIIGHLTPHLMLDFIHSGCEREPWCLLPAPQFSSDFCVWNAIGLTLRRFLMSVKIPHLFNILLEML